MRHLRCIVIVAQPEIGDAQMVKMTNPGLAADNPEQSDSIPVGKHEHRQQQLLDNDKTH